MVTVEADADRVERRLAARQLVCPGCGGVLAGWGRARPRRLRSPAGLVLVRPRRSRCTGCGITHVLLPVSVLVRRADTAAVIMTAVMAKAVQGSGFRPIAAGLGRPAETVRGWLRRLAGRAEKVREWFTVWLVALDPDPVLPDPAGSVFADAVRAIVAVADAARRRFALFTVPLVEVVVALTGGGLLAPGWPRPGAQHESTLPG